jgi:pimeloyl-ACP methyl ester carboxylesterase/Tol biopolymer transport system component
MPRIQKPYCSATCAAQKFFCLALGVLFAGTLSLGPLFAVGVHSTLQTYAQASANGISVYPVLSSDGSILAFSSAANNLGPVDTNQRYDVLVLNRVDHSFELVSRASGLNGALGNSDSRYPDVSLDGRYVVWVSPSTNLVPEESGNDYDVYLRDRQTNLTELIDIADPSAPIPYAPASGGTRNSPPRISGNGCRVVFMSGARNLVADFPDTGSIHWNNVYLRDRCEDRTHLVSRSATGNGNENSGAPVISRDGRYVAFVSNNTRLPFANGSDDVFIYDVEAEAIVKRLDFDSMPGDGPFWIGSLEIDGIGEKLIGVSYAQKSPADTNGITDAYVVDIRSGTFELASAYADGTVPPTGSIGYVSISDDGEQVAFCTSRNLTGELPSGAKDQVWIRNLATGETRLVSRHWQSGNGGVSYPTIDSRIAPSGLSAAFVTKENLDPRDTSSTHYQQIYESSSGYSLQIVDPNPDLIDGGAVTTDIERLRSYGRPALGLAADGVTRLLLRFHASQSGTIRFSLSEIPHSYSDYLGFLSTVGGYESATDYLDVPVVTLSTGEKYAFAVLVAPEGFDRPGNPQDAEARVRPFLVSATELSSGASIAHLLGVLRPPVTLVHGLWSNKATWDLEMLANPHFDTSLFDFKRTNAASFKNNSYHAVVASWEALESVRDRGFAATQVDYIGHSMGGLLARQWVAGDLCAGECNARSDNFLAGDLNRLITLGTPHAGSELANKLWQMWVSPQFAWELRIMSAKYCVDCGAIKDMRAGFAPILEQNPALVPAHAIAGTGGQADESALSKLINYLLLKYLATTRNEVFGNGVEHDGIVKLFSQKGGLLAPNVTVVGPTQEIHAIHTSETNEEVFGSRIEELLRLPPSAEEFAQSGFPAANEIPGIAEPLRASLTQADAPEEVCQPSCLLLQIVDGGPVFHPGAEVSLEATGLEGFEPQEVLFVFGDQEVLVDSPPFVTTVTIPIDAIGEILVGAFAQGQNTWPLSAQYQADFLEESLQVEQEATLVRLRLDPPVLRNSPAFPGRTIRVFGIFSDDVERELVQYPISFSSSDAAIASATSSGYVQFLQPGIASIRVSHQAISATAWVEVTRPPIALQVSQVSPTSATLIVDKLTPLQGLRVFGTTDLTAGYTAVAECLRLELGLKNATLVVDPDPPGEDTTYVEVTVDIPLGATALALQVVTDDCAISPVVVAVP